MHYHNITKDDMLNGEGLRVVLWLSGCNHYCKGCQNSQTWDSNSGIEFDDDAKAELFDELDKNYISGLTLSGGDPLYCLNRGEVISLIDEFRNRYGNTKNIWIYTGYTYEEINNDKELSEIVNKCDVVIDGMFEEENKDVNYPWAGSTNQKVIVINKGE